MRVRLVGRLAAIVAGLTAGSAAAQDGVTLTAVGDRLVIAGDDPAQVALAYDLARMLVKGQGTEPYRVFRLRNSNAADAARVLGEWFNGAAARPASPAGGFDAAGPADGGKLRVRIVAEQASNSLLVRASALDLITVQKILETVIDVGPGDSKAVMKPFFIGPLEHAVAAEVVAILKEVYREQTGEAAAGGFGGFGESFARPGPDPAGRSKPATLALAADDRSNTVVGMASELLATELTGVVRLLEERSRDARKVVQLVPTQGIDPALVQEVLTMIQGPPPAAPVDHPAMDWSSAGPGMSPFGGGPPGQPLALPGPGGFKGGFAMPPGGRGMGPAAGSGSGGRAGGSRGGGGGGRPGSGRGPGG